MVRRVGWRALRIVREIWWQDVVKELMVGSWEFRIWGRGDLLVSISSRESWRLRSEFVVP